MQSVATCVVRHPSASVSSAAFFRILGRSSARGIQWQRYKKASSVFSSSSSSVKFSAMDLNWQPFSLLSGWEMENLQAEEPLLLELCEDLDWKKQAEDLRQLALLSLPLNDGNRDRGNSGLETQSLKEINPEGSRDNGGSKSNGYDSDFIAGVLLAAILLQNSIFFRAFAAENELSQSTGAGLASAPGWLAPTVLAFPLASYIIFNIYRDKMNPYAKVTDWMFGVAVVAIVANLILISTIGVRLY
eukprot:c18629_g1_i1 orf=202-936(+)